MMLLICQKVKRKLMYEKKYKYRMLKNRAYNRLLIKSIIRDIYN